MPSTKSLDFAGILRVTVLLKLRMNHISEICSDLVHSTPYQRPSQPMEKSNPNSIKNGPFLARMLSQSLQVLMWILLRHLFNGGVLGLLVRLQVHSLYHDSVRVREDLAPVEAQIGFSVIFVVFEGNALPPGTPPAFPS